MADGKSATEKKIEALGITGRPALLVLEDGWHRYGRAFAADGEALGEVVFNTSMSGYQEILTDPSYSGQLMTMTCPQIGNYGVNSDDVESGEVHSRAFIVREHSPIVSNWRAENSLDAWLTENGVVGIDEIDTRALTKHIRSAGAMRGAVSTTDLEVESLLERVRLSPSMEGLDLANVVTRKKSETLAAVGEKRFRVVAVDCGIKKSIVENLRTIGAEVVLVPCTTAPEEITAMRPDGLFITNGPGDPAPVTCVRETVRALLGKVPLFGICLGHQILALALGGKTFKLKFGHRGGNHPVKDLATGRVEITSQNHGFAVASDDALFSKGSPFGGVELTHLNLNDETVEGIRCLDVPAFSVQYHPESSPGPHDSRYLFGRFAEMMEAHRAKA